MPDQTINQRAGTCECLASIIEKIKGARPEQHEDDIKAKLHRTQPQIKNALMDAFGSIIHQRNDQFKRLLARWQEHLVQAAKEAKPIYIYGKPASGKTFLGIEAIRYRLEVIHGIFNDTGQFNPRVEWLFPLDIDRYDQWAALKSELKNTSCILIENLGFGFTGVSWTLAVQALTYRIAQHPGGTVITSQLGPDELRKRAKNSLAIYSIIKSVIPRCVMVGIDNEP